MSASDLHLSGRAHLRVVERTPSTNDDARMWARDGAPDGACVVADEQTAGRGRHGRSWHSPPGCNLYLSQVARLGPAHRGLLPLLGAAATREAVATALGDRVRPTVKWPNDILVDGLKVAGILTELHTENESFGILGIGVNVNPLSEDFPPSLRRRAGSLRMFLDRPVDRGSLLEALLDRLDHWRAVVREQPAALVQALRRHCSTLGVRVRVQPPSAPSFEGWARSIDDDGILLVEDAAGQIVRVLAGDVEPLNR